MLPAQAAGHDRQHPRALRSSGDFWNIHASSISGRATAEELYLSSADWMNRNMLRRVELAWPVTDPAQRQRIVDECLVASLHDSLGSWELQADGRYERVSPPVGQPELSSQNALMARYALRDARGG